MTVSQTCLSQVCALFAFFLSVRQDSNSQWIRSPLWEATSPLVPTEAQHRDLMLPSLAWRPGSRTARQPTPRPLGPSAHRHQHGGQQMAFIDK